MGNGYDNFIGRFERDLGFENFSNYQDAENAFKKWSGLKHISSSLHSELYARWKDTVKQFPAEEMTRSVDVDRAIDKVLADSERARMSRRRAPVSIAKPRTDLWSDAEENLLKSVYSRHDVSVDAIARQLGRSKKAIYQKAWKMDISRGVRHGK
jgi:hypothetical protein